MQLTLVRLKGLLGLVWYGRSRDTSLGGVLVDTRVVFLVGICGVKSLKTAIRGWQYIVACFRGVSWANLKNQKMMTLLAR